MTETLFACRVPAEQAEYEIEVTASYDETEPTTLRLAAKAAVRRRGEESWQSVNIDLDVSFETRQIQVFHDGRVIATVPLALDLPFADVAVDAVQDAIDHALDVGRKLGAPAIERLVELLPAGDPLLGCLLRSAVSTSVGQIIRCWHTLEEHQNAEVVIRGIARCLRKHGWSMLRTFAWRTTRCTILLGIPIFI